MVEHYKLDMVGNSLTHHANEFNSQDSISLYFALQTIKIKSESRYGWMNCPHIKTQAINILRNKKTSNLFYLKLFSALLF